MHRSPPLHRTAPGEDTRTCDEAFEATGRPRPAYRRLMARLAGEDLDAVTVRVNELLAERGVVFGGDDPHPFRAARADPRVALQEGSMVVNSSREGGAKPTWVMA